MATPKYKKLCPSGHEIHNFGKPFLSHHYFTLSLSEPCPRVENKYIHFTFFTPKLPPIGIRVVQLLFLPYRCYIPNMVKICPVVLEKKM